MLRKKFLKSAAIKWTQSETDYSQLMAKWKTNYCILNLHGPSRLLRSPNSTLLVQKPDIFNEDTVCVYCVVVCVLVSTRVRIWTFFVLVSACVSGGQHSSKLEKCECACVHLFVCPWVLEDTKIEAAQWVQAHAYAWTHSPPARSWLTQTRQRLNLSWHPPPQLCNTVQQCAGWGWLGEVCLLYVCLPSMEFMKELRDQTAADGVCLADVLALLYPVGQ